MRCSPRPLLPLLSLLAACDGASIVSRPRVDAGALPDAATALDAPDGPRVVVGEPARNASGWVSGSVFDADLGEALANVAVSVDGAPAARSDADGLFSLTLARGLHVVTVVVDGRLPFRREVVVGRAPTALRVPLLTRAAARPVDPAGTVLSLRDDGSITFPAGAVDAVTQVSATWVPPHALEALDLPVAIDRGGGSVGVPSAALVVSDLATNTTVRVRLPRPAEVLAPELELRALDADGNLTERHDPVADGAGFVEFDVDHFSTYVLVEKRGPAPALTGCEDATQLAWYGELLAIRRNGLSIDLARGNVRRSYDAQCGDISGAPRASLQGLAGNFSAWTATARFTLSHRGVWRALFDGPLSDPSDQIQFRSTKGARFGVAIPMGGGTWDIVAEDGIAAQVSPLDCTGGELGLAITALNGTPSSRPRLVVTPPMAEPVIVQPDTEWRVCPAGRTPVGPPPLTAPRCRDGNGCPMSQRCDPYDQRCVVDLDGACSPTATCTRGLLCQSGRCVTPPTGPIACRTDVDCPDQRCNRRSGQCTPPPEGPRETCIGPSDCPFAHDCVSPGVCVYTTYRQCGTNRDCPVNSECYIGRCRPPLDPPCADSRMCPVYGSSCIGGACRLVPTCAAGEIACNGRCSPLTTVQDCGACGVVAPERPNAAPACGSMGPTFRCHGGFADCDGNAANGCEAMVLSNTNCGRCGNACAAGTVCDAGRCVTATRSTVAQVVLGRAHGCARYENGRVRCWGTGAPGPRATTGGTPGAPVDMGLDAVTQLSSGADHVCARRTDSSLWCWGRNDLRQLNDGTTVERASPTFALRDVAEVAAGDEFTCARRTNGDVTCWGSNSNGQLGPSVSADGRYGTPAPPGSVSVAQIAAGRGHACLRTEDGLAFCWGRCEQGQAGNCLQGGRESLNRVSANVAELALAGNISVLRRNDGAVLTWGNATGGTEMSRTSPRPAPIAVSLPEAAVQIAAGPLHVCARLVDGRVMCWGRGDVERSATPRAILTDMSVTQVAVGAQNACVIRGAEVLCWGSGDGGMMLPSGDGRAAPTPRAMTLL